jgi:hypothetical protein
MIITYAYVTVTYASVDCTESAWQSAVNAGSSYPCSSLRPMTDPIAAEARRLRTEEALSVRQIAERLGVGRRRLAELLLGVPVPARTKRPTARDDLRSRAVELRREGWSVSRIAEEVFRSNRSTGPRSSDTCPVPGGTTR